MSDEKIEINSSNIKEYIRKFVHENMTVEVNMDTDWEGEYQYATCSVNVEIRDPETGDVLVTHHEYDSARIDSDGGSDMWD